MKGRVAAMWIVVQGPREDLGRNKAWLLEGERRQRSKELRLGEFVRMWQGRSQVGEAGEEGMPGWGQEEADQLQGRGRSGWKAGPREG